MKSIVSRLCCAAIVGLVAVELNAATFTYSYDSLNRITNAAYSDGSSEVYSYDNAGNRLLQANLAATSRLDTTPPSVPANLATNDFTPGQILLSWSRSFDTGGSGMAGYRVFVNGGLVADTTATSFLLTGLLLDTEYCLTVAAYDRYTNFSIASPPLCLYIPSGAGIATIKITPVLLAAQPSSSWTNGADTLIADALANSINTNIVIANPGDYAVCNNRINWYNLAFSESTPMWDGVLNPPAPWNNEYGHVVWALIDARANSGGDDLSLDSLQVVYASNDGNILSGTNSFETSDYTPRALAVKADGTRITSGTASQKGLRILLLVQSRLFNGGNTQSGLDEIKNWISDYSPYTLTYTAGIIGDEEATRSSSSVTVGGQTPVAPRLSLSRDGILSVILGETDRIYTIQTKSVLNDPWNYLGTISGTNSIGIFMATNVNQFFRAWVQ